MMDIRECAPVTSKLMEHNAYRWSDQEVRTDDNIALEGIRPLFRLESLPLPLTSFEADTLDGVTAAVGERLDKMTLFGWRGDIGDGEQRHLRGLICDDAIRCWERASLGKMLQLLKQLKWYGPFLAVVAQTEDEGVWQARGRLMQKNELIAEVVATPLLIEDQLILVQLTADCCRIVVGQELLAEQLEDGNVRLSCVIVPQVRSDYYGNAGVAVRGF